MPSTSPWAIPYPDGPTNLTALQTHFANIANATNAALTLGLSGAPRAVSSEAERNALYPAPLQGNAVARLDKGWVEQYMNASTVVTPGWYDTATRNFYKRGTDLNPNPTAVTDVPASSVTIGLESPRFCTFDFGCKFQINQSLTAYLYLNVDGVDVVGTFYGRQESGGTPTVGVADAHGMLLAAGAHTIKLRTQSTLASLSVSMAPWWKMVATVPILGTYN